MRKLKLICMTIISFAIIFTSLLSFASETPELNTRFTKDYLEWKSLSSEEQEKTVLPRISVMDFPEEFDSTEKNNYYNLRSKVVNGIFEKNAQRALVGTNGYEYVKYDLKDRINVNVKHQEDTNECWAFSMISVLETNLSLVQNVTKRFSPRHMDYSLIRYFSDGVNEDTYNRSPRNWWTCRICYCLFNKSDKEQFLKIKCHLLIMKN